MSDTAKGIAFIIISAVTLIGGFTSSLYVIGVGIVALPLLATIMCIKDGKGMGPMTMPVIILSALMLIGVIGTVALRNPTVPIKYILGFSPGAAMTIFLIWIATMAFSIAYAVHFRFLLSDTEKEEYDREIQKTSGENDVKGGTK